MLCKFEYGCRAFGFPRWLAGSAAVKYDSQLPALLHPGDGLPWKQSRSYRKLYVMFFFFVSTCACVTIHYVAVTAAPARW